MSTRTASPSNALSAALAVKIVEWVQARDLPVGAHLTEQSLVEVLHVSRSPVRKALALLADQGVLDREKNRGYFLRRLTRGVERALDAADARHGESLYLQVADDRLRGTLADEFSEAELRRRYGITQPQARAILQRMAREDLVVRKPGRGWRFQPTLTTRDAHDQSYRFRMIIEPAALLEPGYRVDREAFARIRREQQAMLDGDLARLTRDQVFRVGSAFHETIVAGSGNRFLADAMRRQNQLRRLIEYGGNSDRSRLVRQCEEHLRLLDLIEAGRRKAAADFLREHLDVVREIKTGVADEPRRRSRRPAVQL